ncbi:NR5A2 isoform 6, partial [Pan troglodytes]
SLKHGLTPIDRGNCRSGCFSFAATLRQRSLLTSCAGLPDRHGSPIPARGRLVMLPKVETEALGLARSHGE